jgi:hypothetical protein
MFRQEYGEDFIQAGAGKVIRVFPSACTATVVSEVTLISFGSGKMTWGVETLGGKSWLKPRLQAILATPISFTTVAPPVPQ